MHLNAHNKPAGGAAVYLNDVMQYEVLEANEEGGYLRYYEQVYDTANQRWLRKLDPHGMPIVVRKTGRVRVVPFDDAHELQKYVGAYLLGLMDGRAGSSNWGAAAYPGDFTLQKVYDYGHRAGLTGH